MQCSGPWHMAGGYGCRSSRRTVNTTPVYYLLLCDLADHTAFIAAMKAAGIHCVFHYVPLHTSPYGRRVGRVHGALPVTSDLAGRLVRLPLWLGLEEHQAWVIDTLMHTIGWD